MSNAFGKYLNKDGYLKGGLHVKNEAPRNTTMKDVKTSAPGVGVQTHGGRMGSALNTQRPDQSKFLNEDGYLKGGVPVKNG
jgi:hypothetical protein|tara:strand:- start:235 stop:477 length:243 start_codon:yes stop_codon:yes gene_type:complete